VRQFASGGFRIWNLGREAKIVYTGFGVFALLALFVSVLFYEDLVGRDTAGVRGYYAGEAGTRSGHVDPPTGGPVVELPPDAQPPRLTVAVTYRKLLEVTHFHLFTVPVFLLIIAHLFMLTGLSARAKAIWIAGGWISSLLHLAAPWLIRYGSSSLSWLYPLSGALMALTLTVMTAYPMVVMWRKPRESVAT
jgi:hypothetical protein